MTAAISTLPSPALGGGQVDQSALCADEESVAGAKPAPGLLLPLRAEVAEWGQVGAGAGGRPPEAPSWCFGCLHVHSLVGEGPHIGGSEVG